MLLFLMDIQYGFYKEQGDLQQANAFTLEFEIAPFGISSEGDAIFSCMDRKTSEGMAIRLTSDRKVEVILGFGGRQMVFYSIRENVDLAKMESYICYLPFSRRLV